MRKWLPWIRRQTSVRIALGISEGIGNAIGAAIVTAVLSLFGALGYWLWQSDWSWLFDDSEVTNFLSRGNAFLDTGRYGLALDDYEGALKRDPDNTAAAFGRNKARLFAAYGPGFRR